jgi:hypothetical protein
MKSAVPISILITITGTLLSLPSGAMNGAIEVASFETIDSP